MVYCFAILQYVNIKGIAAHSFSLRFRPINSGKLVNYTYFEMSD